MAKAETGSKTKATEKPSSKGATKKASSTKSASAKGGDAPKATKKSAAEAPAKTPPQPTTATTQAARAVQAGSTLDNVELPSTHGTIGVFGGPKDRGIKPDDKLALPTGPHFVYERARSLNPKSYYCAMRWDYRLEHKSPEEGKRWWANKKLVVTNPKTGKSVVVRAVDYGPHEKTGLTISVSPGAAEALGVEVGEEVDIAFADQKAPLGPVE